MRRGCGRRNWIPASPSGGPMRGQRPAIHVADVFFRRHPKSGTVARAICGHDVDPTRPAFSGLYPRKGAIREGSDADMVIWDPNQVGKVAAQEGFSKADYSVY